MNSWKLESLLRAGTLFERCGAAQQLAQGNEKDIDVLVHVALDVSENEETRILAVSNIPVSNKDALRKVIPNLLKEELPVLQVWAIEKSTNAGLVEFIDEIAELIGSTGTYTGFEGAVSVSEVAAKAVECLLQKR
jgi:hypothetical protein